MSKTLTLEISDPIYQMLLKTAKQIGQTPEQVVLNWLENRVKQSTKDPLLQLAGIFDSDLTDISEHHDEYIGNALRDNHEYSICRYFRMGKFLCKDKTWNLVDSASFTVMRHHRIGEAFSTDHHFDQAGFVRKLGL